MLPDEYLIFCPLCKDPFFWEGFKSIRVQPVVCVGCSTKYRGVFGTVRAKRSRQSGYSREFALRLLGEHGEEELVEWESVNSDVEMRAKDAVALLSIEGRVVTATNYTISRHFDMTEYGWIPPAERERRLAKYAAENQQVPWYKRALVGVVSPEQRLRQELATLAARQQPMHPQGIRWKP